MATIAAETPAAPGRGRKKPGTSPTPPREGVAVPAEAASPASPAAGGDGVADVPEVIEYFRPEVTEVWTELDIRAHSRTPEAVAELRASIVENGRVLQPCRAKRRPGKPPLIFMGVTRREACIGTGRLLPVIQMDIEEKQALAIAVTENVGRNNLSPIEEGQAYERMLLAGHTTREIAEIVGKDQAVVMARRGLLKVREDVQQMVIDGVLTPTHVRDYLLRFTKITVEEPREKFFTTLVQKVRAAAAAGASKPIETPELVRLIRDAAVPLSYPLRSEDRYAAGEDVPLFAAAEHKECPCNGPQFTLRLRDQYRPAQEATRCWNRQWYNAAQQAASVRRAAEEERIRAAAQARVAKVKELGAAVAAGAAPPPKLTEVELRRHFPNARAIDSVHHGPDLDPAGLKNAELVIVHDRGERRVYAVNGGVVNHAAGLFTRRVNARAKELRDERARADAEWLKTARLEPWMLIQLMNTAPGVEAARTIAEEMGWKHLVWNGRGGWTEAATEPQLTQLAMLLALRAKRGDCATSANNGYYFTDPLLKRAREEMRADVKQERDALVAAVLAAGGQKERAGAAGTTSSTRLPADTLDRGELSDAGVPAALQEQRADAMKEVARLFGELEKLLDVEPPDPQAVQAALTNVRAWMIENDLGPVSKGKRGVSVRDEQLLSFADAVVAVLHV